MAVNDTNFSLLAPKDCFATILHNIHKSSILYIHKHLFSAWVYLLASKDSHEWSPFGLGWGDWHTWVSTGKTRALISAVCALHFLVVSQGIPHGNGGNTRE